MGSIISTESSSLIWKTESRSCEGEERIIIQEVGAGKQSLLKCEAAEHAALRTSAGKEKKGNGNIETSRIQTKGKEKRQRFGNEERGGDTTTDC